MEIHLRTVVVDCEDAHRAAHFYSKLLGWPITLEEPDWVLLRDPQGGTGLSFQTEEDYARPVWPEELGKPMKMLHLDFQVDDLPAAAAHALACGAVKSPQQFFGGPGRHRVFRHRGPPLLSVFRLKKKKGRASQAGGPSLSGKYFQRRTCNQLGNTRRTVVPSPSVLCRLTLALWKAAPCLTMESPRPVPPISLEWLLSTR